MNESRRAYLRVLNRALRAWDETEELAKELEELSVEYGDDLTSEAIDAADAAGVIKRIADIVNDLIPPHEKGST